MSKFSEREYLAFDDYVRTVLKRLESGAIDATQAREDIMHPLAAWDRNNEQEFLHYMKMKQNQWGGDGHDA